MISIGIRGAGLVAVVCAVVGGSVSLNAQNPPAPRAIAVQPAQSAPADSSGAFTRSLDQLRQTIQTTNMDVERLRIEKWKADANTKSGAQANADSVARNLTSALPDLAEEARLKPQDLGVVFKLYRNLNALYDVLGSLAETAGAFGTKQEYESLATETSEFENERHEVADYLEQLTTQSQAELTRYRSQPQPAAAVTPATPKKIIVDDNTPTKKVVKKKKPAAKPAVTSSPSSQSQSGTGTKATQ